MIRPTNRKKRKNLARKLRRSRRPVEGASIIRMNKNSPSYRRMLTRQNAWRKSETFQVDEQAIIKYLNDAQDRLQEMLGFQAAAPTLHGVIKLC